MAMKILNNLVEKPKITFKFKPTDVYSVYEIINSAKNSKSSGSDSIRMSILKDCPQTASRVICHLYNNMIRTNIYPTILRTSKIIPILKHGKPPTQKDSYRPICILPTVDKVIQTIMRNQRSPTLKKIN